MKKERKDLLIRLLDDFVAPIPDWLSITMAVAAVVVVFFHYMGAW